MQVTNVSPSYESDSTLCQSIIDYPNIVSICIHLGQSLEGSAEVEWKDLRYTIAETIGDL